VEEEQVADILSDAAIEVGGGGVATVVKAVGEEAGSGGGVGGDSGGGVGGSVKEVLHAGQLGLGEAGLSGCMRAAAQTT
jgi:hypothetical protein